MGKDLLDAFDNPFFHPAFLAGGKAVFSSLPVEEIRREGYHLAFEQSRSPFAPGCKIVTVWSHGSAPVGACFNPEIEDHIRSETDFSGLVTDLVEQTGADILLWPFFPIEAREYGSLVNWYIDRFGPGAVGRMFEERHHKRAYLNTRDQGDQPDGLCLKAKKRKELRRQLRRLGDEGEVRFVSSRSGYDDAEALEHFLAVEASGWKADKGTALAVDPKLAEFTRSFAPKMMRQGKADIDLLMLDGHCVAGALSLRAGRGLFTWKIGMDEAYGRSSPGVQIMLEIGRLAMEDPELHYIDSLAIADHPMIDHIWAGRRTFATLLAPLSAKGRLGTVSLATAYRGNDWLRPRVKALLGRS